MPSTEEKNAISELLRPLRSPCIVELGAHCGEEEAWIRPLWTEPVHYVMVEPDPRNCQKILDRHFDMRLVSGWASDCGNASIFLYAHGGTRRLIIGAVSDRAGFQEFHFAYNSKDHTHASGSLREPSGHLTAIPEVDFLERGMVQCYTLDEIFEREYLHKIDLLWADIQGAENLMIAGGRVALAHTRYLFMEIEHTELYAGEGLRDDLVGMLPGWEVLREFEFNILMRNPGFTEVVR